MTDAAAPEPLAANVAVYRLNLDDSRDESQAPALLDDRAWMEPLLQQNAVWFCRLRWIVVTVLGGAGLAGFFPRPLRALGITISPGWPLTAAAVLAILNLVFVSFTGRAVGSHPRVSVRMLLWAQIVTDLLVLTAVIHWLGHRLPAAPFMYLFHIILACIVFTAGESLGVAGLAAGFYLFSLALEWMGWLGSSSVLMPDEATVEASLPGALPGLRVASLLLILGVIWYLVSRLASAFRSRDRELFISNRRLHASIEERSKHMLQTTHQLKAPFAAIHAQSQLLLGDYCGTLPPPARATVEKISARCLVLARQIQEMLQLANLRSQGQTPPPPRSVNLGALIEDAVSRIEPAARQRSVRIEREIHPVTVQAVEDHLTMLVDNLLINAVSYSYDHGIVQVTCRTQQSGEALMVIRDQGIGIPKEKLPRIFDDYYRTEEAVQHNRASTGLGLAIVRQVACKDHVPLTVESAPGWGTRFTVTLPGASAALQPCPVTINN
jgi:signal transduction histidine kinase